MRRSGKSLKDVKFDVVYTSDLQRTIDTAELLLAENEKTALKRPRRVVKCECIRCGLPRWILPLRPLW